ncbi:hypothetical protein EUTSA_v10012373mg, partial [Eutrema salsugineum]
TISHLIDQNDCTTNVVQLENVESKTLSLVIEYCKKHVSSLSSSSSGDNKVEDLKSWDADFMKTDQSTIFGLMIAAHNLNIQSLLLLGCETVVDMISECKTPEEIRELLNLENNYTPEEEAEVRRENSWAFD